MNQKIYVYGTGRYATNFLKNVKLDFIYGFIETRKEKYLFYKKPVFSVPEVEEYDLIIVASQFVHEIRATLYRNGIDLSKVVFLADSWIPAKIVNGTLAFDFMKSVSIPEDECVFFDIGAIYTTSQVLANYMLGTITSNAFWENISYYQTSVHVPHVSNCQRSMLEQSFVKNLSKTDTICDIGCASGEWSRLISPFVSKIDAYDNLIKTGIDISESYGFHNISFYSVDALDIEFKKKYDHALMLGIGIYLEKHKLDNLIKNISAAINNDGYLAVRDTVTMYTDKTVYMIRKEGGNIFENYTATYIPLREYEKLYTDNGFEIIEESYFSSYFHRPMELGAHGYIFRKK